jgi:hypothetical protein
MLGKKGGRTMARHGLHILHANGQRTKWRFGWMRQQGIRPMITRRAKGVPSR